MFDVKTFRATHYGLSVVYTLIVEVKQSDYFHLSFLIPTRQPAKWTKLFKNHVLTSAIR